MLFKAICGACVAVFPYGCLMFWEPMSDIHNNVSKVTKISQNSGNE